MIHIPHKRSIIVGASVAILGITGVTMAATHSEPQLPAKSINKVQSSKVNDTTTEDVTITSEPIAEVAPVTVQTNTTYTEETSTDPVDVFHQAVLTKASVVYQYARNSSLNLNDFAETQYWCLFGRVTDTSSVTQADLDAKLGFFDPVSTDADGTVHYNYFDNRGSCRVFTTP